jgi:serine/threonine-protein kinase
VKISADQWGALSALLDAALELPADQRETWLEALQGTPESLKAELRELLSHADGIETSEFLETLPKFERVPSQERPAVATGARIGTYIIESEIGRGGMGVVWRAHRADGAMKRTVAIKCPRAETLSPELMKRFLLERDILAQLEHPNIARLYDAGVTDLGQPYIALEYVEGVPLTQYCDGRRLGVADRIALFQQVLGAVQYAHTRLVVHRDLKPSNILVTADGQVRLLDFGVAKLLPTHIANDGAMTQIGERAMTPDYAAPEHIIGASITTATDVYSLGVVLYELLSSRRPYQLQRGSVGEIEEAILVADPIRPDRVSISLAEAEARSTSKAKLRRVFSGDLGIILLKALKKNPQERYTTVDALAQDLDRYQKQQPVLAQADTYAYRIRKFLGRNKLSAAAGATALLLILVAAGGFALEARRATQQRDRALALASRNDAVSQFLEDLITDASESDEPTNMDDLLARSERLANLEYKNNPAHRAAVLDMLGHHYTMSGERGKATSLLEEALRIAAGTRDLALLDLLHCDHAGIIGAQKPEEAKAEINRVLARSGVESQQVIDCLAHSSYIAAQMNDGPLAVEYANRALALLREAPAPAPGTEANLLANLAQGYYLSGKNLESDRSYAASVSQFDSIGRGESIDALAARNNWANSNFNVQPRVALQIIDSIIQILHKNSPTSATPPNMLNNRGAILDRIGRYAESLQSFEECGKRGATAQDIATVIDCNLGAASVYRSRGNLAEAERFYLRAFQAADAAKLPAASTPMRHIWANRARLDLVQGEFQPAIMHSNLAIGYQKNSPYSAGVLLIRAEGSLMLGQLDSAMSDVQEALEFARKMQGNKPNSYSVGIALLMKGRVLLAKDDRTGAHRDFMAAVEHLSHTVDEGQQSLVAARDWLQKSSR